MRGVNDEYPSGEKLSRRIQGAGGQTSHRVGSATCPDGAPPWSQENTFHTWIGKYHRVERQETQVQDEHLYEELKRLRKENARLKEEREIVKKAAAYFAQQLP